MEQSLIQKIKEGLYLDGLDPKSYSPLSLAYIGDAIYEIVIRTIVMSAGNMSVNKYHKKSSSMVKASAQKEVFEKIEPFLTEEEMAVYKRGRNSKSGSVAKNASMMDYRKATGVEALVGYLYLAGDMDRIIELIGIGFDLNKKEETGERRDQYRKRFNQSRFIYSGDRCSMLVDPYICWTAYRGKRRFHE